MSIPGQAKNKYTHDVKYVRSRCGLFRIAAGLLVLFVVGMLIAIMCNISSMRRQQGDILRELSELRWRLNQGSNNNGHHNSQEGPQNNCGGSNNHGNHRHPNHHPDHHNDRSRPKFRPQIASIDESINEVKAILNSQLPRLESKMQELNKGLNSKGQFSQKVLRQLQDFQSYVRSLLDPLKKIQSWF